MLKHDFTDIWFKRHGKWHDKIYKNRLESYSALDLWNLFDGLAWKEHRPVYFQIKTNGWANKIKLESCINDKYPDVLVITENVKGSDTHGWEVRNRIHERSKDGILERSIT